ncbi:MAG: hybrid sensor histidine kinase/response regulator [Pseudomonas sp.]|uniref:ATP-binding response regulator n=1 Tax=Pseudomonas sp. TaxID=306 RepID=UPI00339A5667
MITDQTVFLVVDDADSMRKINSSQLTMLGARQILLANNGLEALKLLATRRVDVIISDWNMPVMTGFELLLKVRGDKRIAHLPFIMITADCEREQIAQVIAHGVSSILVKPYNTQHLGQHLARAMQHRPRYRPLPAAEVKPELAAQPLKAKRKRATLLVVDDMPDNLSLISGLFMQDYRVRVAQGGEGALAICTSDDPPDLLLLDVMMPDMDGFELARRLRSHPQASHIPVIFVTARTDAESRQRGLELGAVDFVHKPIDPQLLQRRVGNLLRHVERHCRTQAEYDDLLELARLREEAEQVGRHDLKGPISNILGLASSLLEGGNLLPGQRHILSLLQDNGQQLLGLVDLSAQLYRIEAGRFELEPTAVALAPMLGKLVEAARLTYQAKALVIELRLPELGRGEPAHAWGDESLCYSLLNNLLKNACEAAPEGSRVRLLLEQDEQLCLRMENQTAVPENFRPFFFDKYASQGKKTGSGLGTYSAKKLAEAQGGSLELQVNDLEDSTCLVLTLPGVEMVAPRARAAG